MPSRLFVIVTHKLSLFELLFFTHQVLVLPVLFGTLPRKKHKSLAKSRSKASNMLSLYALGCIHWLLCSPKQTKSAFSLIKDLVRMIGHRQNGLLFSWLKLFYPFPIRVCFTLRFQHQSFFNVL